MSERIVKLGVNRIGVTFESYPEVRDADIVIGANRRVLKDRARPESEGRLATDAEMNLAVKV